MSDLWVGDPRWGWNEAWQHKFEKSIKESKRHREKWASRECKVARVYTEHRGEFWLRVGDETLRSKASGTFLSRVRKGEAERPIVGDWVVYEKKTHGELAVVHGFLPRTTYLRRRALEKRQIEQGLAANLDELWIIVPLDQPIDTVRMERFLALAQDAARDEALASVVVLTKADVVANMADDIGDFRQYEVQVVPVSARTGAGLDVLRQRLIAQKTFVLLGDSGAGKSTLVNALMNAEVRETGDMNRANFGRHTSTNRELILTQEGALIFDTPGLRDLGSAGADTSNDARTMYPSKGKKSRPRRNSDVES